MDNKVIIQSIDIAVTNIKRLNNLRLKGKLTKETWQEFFIYKNILLANDSGIYTKEVKDIIYDK